MLTTKRLILRNVEKKDLEAVHALHSLPQTDRYNTLGIPENVDITRDILTGWIDDNKASARQNYFLTVELNSTQQFIGMIALKLNKPKYCSAEIWYKFHVEHWGKGYATEAVKALLDFGFHQLGLHRIEAGCAVDNAGSVRVLEKAGFLREGIKRQVLPLKSGWSDGYEYGILSDDPRP